MVANSYSGHGLDATSSTSSAINGYGGTYGVYASGNTAAGYFSGNVTITGNVQVNGTINKSAVGFKVDHPLDPANKFLYHSCVESNEMINIYRGNIKLDSEGKATVDMPSWTEAENCDFSYQLTAIGNAAPNLHIVHKMDANRFEIGGGQPDMEVSWQVTGVRQDAYAKAHPIQVEKEKTGIEKGKYIDPIDFGEPKSLGINYEEDHRALEHGKAIMAMKAPHVSDAPRLLSLQPALKLPKLTMPHPDMKNAVQNKKPQ